MAPATSSRLLVQREFGGERDDCDGAQSACSRNWTTRLLDSEISTCRCLISLLHSAAPQASSTTITASSISSSSFWHLAFESTNQAVSGSDSESLLSYDADRK